MVKPIENIMQKEMTRQEFLATLGFGLVSIMGFSQIIHLLTGKSLGHHYSQASAGYGNSAYGGGSDGMKK